MKAALEGLPSVGTVNITRHPLGGDLFSWIITFTEPATSAYSVLADEEEAGNARPLLSFPLLYGGGGGGTRTLGIHTLGSGGSLNVTRLRRGTFGPLTGKVCSPLQHCIIGI